MLTQTELDTLIERIVARIQPEKVIVFGSYAKGTATLKSDLDLFIIKASDVPMKHRVDEVLPLLYGFLIPVDVHVYTPEEVDEYGRQEFSFVNSVLKSGRTVYKR